MPTYPLYTAVLAKIGALPSYYRLDHTRDWQPDLDHIRSLINPRTRALVVIDPNNPTGAVYPEAALREVNRLCAQRGLVHIHDEAYEYFVYDGAKHFSPSSIPGAAGHTISIYSLSKSHGFASWRIGAMVIPERLLTAVRKIQDTILICAPVISQFAAVGALRAGATYGREKLRGIAEVRAIVLEELRRLAPLVEVPRADGAFYFLLRVRTALNPLDVVSVAHSQHVPAITEESRCDVLRECEARVPL